MGYLCHQNGISTPLLRYQHYHKSSKATAAFEDVYRFLEQIAHVTRGHSVNMQ